MIFKLVDITDAEISVDDFDKGQLFQLFEPARHSDTVQTKKISEHLLADFFCNESLAVVFCSIMTRISEKYSAYFP